MTDTSNSPNEKEILLKPSVEYFSHEAPDAFRNMKFVNTNVNADILFGIRTETVNIYAETGIVIIPTEEVEISKYHIKSGDSCALKLDPKVATEDLNRIIRFYVLTDFLGVLVTYNTDDYILKQHLLVFDHTRGAARKIYEKNLVLNGMSFHVCVGLGELASGRILVHGSTAYMNGELVAYSISADPRPWAVIKYPDINLTTQIAKFVTLLKADHPNYEIFAAGIFLHDKYMYCLIKHQEDSIISLHTIGRMRLCDNDENKREISKDRYKLINATGHIQYMGGIYSGDLINSVQRGRSVWLAFVPPDYDVISTVSWRFSNAMLPYIQGAINFCINCSRRLQRYDNGWSHRYILRILQWIYGPTMAPSIAPPNAFQIYNLDLKNFVYKRAECELKLIQLTPNNYNVPVLLDCDARGGLLMVDIMVNDHHMKIRYFSPPHQPETLSRLCHNMIYRNYPSFEKSEMVRRSLGVCDFRWRI